MGPSAGTCVPFGSTTIPSGLMNGNRSLSSWASIPIRAPGAIVQFLSLSTFLICAPSPTSHPDRRSECCTEAFACTKQS
jgi:hypothetical protein